MHLLPLLLFVQFVELLFLCVNVEGVKHVIHVAHHESRKVMHAHVDAVVGDSVLRIVVGPDFFRTVAIAYH